MNEDDTFKKLRQSPFLQVFEEYMQLKSLDGLDAILDKHGWTNTEFSIECATHYKDIMRTISEKTTFEKS